MKRVVITGLGVVSPIGVGKRTFLESLRSGHSGVGRITHFDPTDFSSQVAGEVKDFNPQDFMEKKKTRRTDRYTQFALASAKEAIEDAGLKLIREDPFCIGVIIGSGIGGIETLEENHKILLEKGPSKISPYMMTMILSNMAAGEVAIEWGLKGPNYSICSACATATHAIGDALRLLRYGDAAVMLAGGTDAGVTPLGVGGFCAIKALSTSFNDQPEKASRPFDAKRDGFIIAEGCGVLVLETLQHAQARGAHIYAELAGYGATDDAYHVTAPGPDAESSARAMKFALQDGDIHPEEVDYINAHGTSTSLNDKAETQAIKKVFGERAYAIPVSSAKSMVGHLLGAAGSVELIAGLLGMENNFIPPTINYEFPDADCDLDYVPNRPREQQINVMLKNSLGFGGHNAVIVVKRFQ